MHFQMPTGWDVHLLGVPPLGCTFLGANCISWSAKKQPIVARSSAEAEYRSMASTATELTWLTFLLRDLHVPLLRPPVLHCDNLSALHLFVNPVLHAMTKHIELDIHYVHEQVAIGALETRFVTSSLQLADRFTKPLAKLPFHTIRSKFGLCPDMRLRLKKDDKMKEQDIGNHQDISP